ncbi:unnamed protein product [Effrenium voratum]|nr:unnamed protein product [Effrenium voratum]
MLRQPLVWAAVLAALTVAERVRPGFDICNMDHSFRGTKEVRGLAMSYATVFAAFGSLLEPLIVRGNLTVPGNATFHGNGWSAFLQEACLQVTDGLTVSVGQVSGPGECAQRKRGESNGEVDVYPSISANMLPTPAKSHYTFNLRDLAKVNQDLPLQQGVTSFRMPASLSGPTHP